MSDARLPTFVPTSAPSPTATAEQQNEADQQVVLISGQGGAAQQVVVEFLQAVSTGDVEKSLSYWNLEQPDQPDNYAEFIRHMVSQWAAGEHRFVVGETNYGGLVAPHDYRPLDEDDPRVQSALVDVRINGLEHSFSLEIVAGRWQIEGLIVQ